MDEQTCLSLMVAPGTRRPGKYREGVCQIRITGACDMHCVNCTQDSQLRLRAEFMPVDMFEQAVLSLKGYFGVYGVFGGNPALHPEFEDICAVLRKHVPYEQRGLWCNNPIKESRGQAMRETFCPSVSNLNVHMSQTAYDNFKKWWPECNPCGLDKDSRHSPCKASMIDMGIPIGERYDLISRCDINQHWSPMLGMFRGELRAWFCEEAGAQAIMFQDNQYFPDTGHRVVAGDKYICDEGIYDYWWQMPMSGFRDQVRQHCHNCAVPLKGYGGLALDDNYVQLTTTMYADHYRPKKGTVVVTDNLEAYRPDALASMVDYLGNSKR